MGKFAKGATFPNYFLNWCCFGTYFCMGLFFYVKCMRFEGNRQPHWWVWAGGDTWHWSRQLHWRFDHAGDSPVWLARCARGVSFSGLQARVIEEQGAVKASAFGSVFFRAYSQWHWQDHWATNRTQIKTPTPISITTSRLLGFCDWNATAIAASYSSFIVNFKQYNKTLSNTSLKFHLCP